MTDVNVASVVMPERGVFLVRCLESMPLAECKRGRRVIVALDYGLDVGEVVDAAQYDPAVHGERIPGYRLERFAQEVDLARMSENEAVAETMRAAFERSAVADVPDIRILSARLSFGRTRLFLRYVSELRRPDLSRASGELKRGFNVSVNAWQMGPRDEVACMGAIGPCGRVCCCASWQKRFPAKFTSQKNMNQAGSNGICGRFKCCWSFEENLESS